MECLLTILNLRIGHAFLGIGGPGVGVATVEVVGTIVKPVLVGDGKMEGVGEGVGSEITKAKIKKKKL